MSTPPFETQSRMIARVISYRIAALILTAVIVGLKDAVIIHILLTILHYGAERVWLLIDWGRV